MTEQEQMLLMLKGVISEYTPEETSKYEDVKAKVKELVIEAGDLGLMALSVVALEVSQK